MNTQIREWWLFLVMSLLIVVLVALAWWDVPPLSPVAVTYSTPNTQTTVTTSPSAVSERPVSLNTATKEELMRLEGLGEKTAEKILAYRDSHGGFDSVEELLNVEGVGEKKLAAWKPYLTV